MEVNFIYLFILLFKQVASTTMGDVVMVYKSDFQKQDEKIEMLTADLNTVTNSLSTKVEEIKRESDERSTGLKVRNRHIIDISY